MDEKNIKIDKFILNNVESSSKTIVSLVSGRFNISRQSAHKHVAREVENKNLVKTGHTRSTQYFLAEGKHIEFSLKIDSGLREQDVWTKYVKSMIKKYPENIYKICQHSFTEIFNNVIDHSEGTVVHTIIDIKDGNIEMAIIDDGVGIFEKIKKALKLSTAREAILHLSKGKFTTDPTKHSGQGIFFTSRFCDSFSILSCDMYYTFAHDEWFLSNERKLDVNKGTYIKMIISLGSKKEPKKIFDKFSDEERGFHKSTVAVALSNDPNDPHVSRSQAKRLLMGLEKFKTIVLNFKDVESVGQAFVDEVFRVFQNEYPGVKIHYVNANKEVESMIRIGLANK